MTSIDKSDPYFDIDTYINRLEKTIQHQNYLIESLKNEIRIQRKEIAGLREERKMLLNSDSVPMIDHDLWKENESNDIQ
jgi:hypothetical protein